MHSLQLSWSSAGWDTFAFVEEAAPELGPPQARVASLTFAAEEAAALAEQERFAKDLAEQSLGKARAARRVRCLGL